MKKILIWAFGIFMVVSFGVFLGVLIGVSNSPPPTSSLKVASTVNSPPVEALPIGAWRVNRSGVGCVSQEIFLEVVSNFNRYDKATATDRMAYYLEEPKGSSKSCVVFNVGDVVRIDEVDKLLQTVSVYRANERPYYSSSVLLSLTQ